MVIKARLKTALKEVPRSYFVVASLMDDGEIAGAVPDAIVHGRLDHRKDSLELSANRPPAFRNAGNREAQDLVTTSLAEDDQIFVAWRRLNRGIETGVACPGRPFEVAQNGVRLRVEAREVVPDGRADDLTDEIVTLAALPRLQAELQAKGTQVGFRQRIRDHREQFLAFVASCEDGIFQRAVSMKGLPAGQLARVIETSELRVAGITEGVKRRAIGFLARADLDEDTVNEMAFVVGDAQRLCQNTMDGLQRFADARTLLTQKIAEMEKGFDRQERGLAFLAEEVTRLAQDARETREPREPREARDPHDVALDPRRAKRVLNGAQRELARARAHAQERARALSIDGDLTQGMAEDLSAEPFVHERELIRSLEDLKTLFPGNEIKAALRFGAIFRGLLLVKPVTNAAGELRAWEVWLKNGGDAPWIGAVSLKNHGNFDGAGLRFMSVPERGSAAMQQIKTSKTYGERPKAGANISLLVRGYGQMEVSLPEAGNEILVPISNLRIDGNGNLPTRASATAERDSNARAVLSIRPGSAPPKKRGSAGQEQDNPFDPDCLRALEARQTAFRNTKIRERLASGELPVEIEALLERGKIAPGFGVAYWREQARACCDAILGSLPRGDDLEALALALDRELAPLTDLRERIEMELKKRVDSFDVDVVRRAGGHVIAPPTVAFKVLRRTDDGRYDLEVSVQNNDERPIQLAIRCGRERARSLAFEGRGRTAVFHAEGVEGPVGASITAIGVGQSRRAYGQCTVECASVAISSPDFALNGDETVRQILPYMFTVLAEQPKGRPNVVLEEKGTAAYTTKVLPLD